MRCYWRKVLKTGSLLLFLSIFYLFVNYLNTEKSESQELHQWVKELMSEQFHSTSPLQVFQQLQRDSKPFNMSYKFLAGFPKPSQKFLTVGLSSIKRKHGFYLLDTLHSIFTQSSEEELEEMVVLVLLADFDMEWNEKILKAISDKLSKRILKGQLLVVHLGQEYYPPLVGLKRNFNDAPDRVYFRSKQNVDYAFLFSVSANLSRYFIMLEDDVVCSRNFFTHITRFINTQSDTSWVTVEFSKLGFIGKLYHSSDLPRLASFLLLFYQEMPCDWLLGHFSRLLVQNKPIYFKPSLFQHMGLYSSFQGSVNKLKDDNFEENPMNIGENPPAEIYTDITHYMEYKPKNSYVSTGTFFWGKSPSAGNHFTVVFHKPAVLKRILIQTGSKDKKDILVYADVEVGYRLKGKEKNTGCSEYIKVGRLVDGQFDKDNLEENITSSVFCLRLSVQESQQDWVIINRISVWTKDLPLRTAQS